MAPNYTLPRHNRTRSFDTYGAWGSNDHSVPHHSTYPRTLSLDDTYLDADYVSYASFENPYSSRDYPSQLQNGIASRQPHGDNPYASSSRGGLNRDGEWYYPVQRDNERGYSSRRSQSRALGASYPARRTWGDDDNGYSSRRIQDGELGLYEPVHRSWGEDHQRASDNSGYSGNGYLSTPMSTWERENSREQAWNGVGGVYSEASKRYGYDNSGAGTGDYGYSSGRSVYWDSVSEDVCRDRVYGARGSSCSSRIGR
ncbi:hypothetical protein ABVK25_005840 [Lepraria finkii]|uniref:Uncharacterized protein n=1 Tax=Lepraria finkii TaxID=1340010 RepID=A0ABR4BAL9_9LECA